MKKLQKGEKSTKGLLAMSDDDIDYSDIPALTSEFWDNAKVVMPETRTKKKLTIRVDMEVYEWFKDTGKGYQTLMNNVLKGYVDSHNHPDK